MNKFYHPKQGWINRQVCRIKRLKGPQVLRTDNDRYVIMFFLRSMGYKVYWNPGNEDIGELIVSDRTMTYGDCRRYYKRLGINLEWWKDTEFANKPNEELEEV